MKRLLTLCLFCFSVTVGLLAQGSVAGVVVDSESNEGLVGATVLVKGTNKGAITDIDGSFTLTDLSSGDYTLVVSYVGFETMEMNVSVGSGVTDLGQMSLQSSAVGLDEVQVISSIAIDRRTPVAVSTLKGDYVEARVGNQEYPEILRKTPSIYVTKQGGGFGDSRINVRGFNQRNTAVMINGIPVNDMENGWVYWSNWAGLADVTSNLQVQRGLGASKLAVASVGGSINIVTNAAAMSQGGTASVSIGNDGYQKYGLSYNTGLSESGWAVSAQMTHTRGDGYVQGTMFRAYSYFLSITKEINNNHTIAVTALGAPQWHHQRLIPGRFDNINMRTFHDPDNTGEEDTNLGIDWNWTHGMLGGEEFNWRRNFYHKPKAFINHYWNINPTTDLKTSAYVSLGRGGGTGPRGRLRTPGSVFDSFGGTNSGIHDANGHVRFDDLMAYHQGSSAFPEWGQKIPASEGPFAGQYVSSSNGRVNGSGDEGTGFIRRASMNSHNWYGVLSTLTTELNDNLDLIAGVDWRYYKGIHYRRLENLLGNDAYLSQSDDNDPARYISDPSEADFGNFADDSYKDKTNILNYYNDGLVNWIGLFAQVEYNTDKTSVFAAVSGSNQGFKRIDYFNYLDSDPQRETDYENFLGGTIKAGANFNLDDNSNVFVNAGYYSKQPIFDNVYINFVNELNENVKNQSVTAFEAGYGYRSRDFNVKANVYYTNWGNRQFDISTENELDEDILYNFEDVDQNHLGFELETSYQPTRALQFTGMLSIGDWKYASNPTARGTNLDTQQPVADAILYIDGLEVGDAAQTTFNIGATYEIAQGLRIYADLYSASRLFAQYDVDDDQYFDPNFDAQVVELPSYTLVDAGVSYNFDLGEDLRASWRFNMNNVFDELYISELVTNIPDDPSTSINELYDNRGVFGFGRTWNTSIKLYF